MLLHAAGLVVRHHASHPPVLDRVDLDVGAGEVVAIVGANGSGKSTLARALAGLVRLEAGSVGSSSMQHSPRVGLVLQDPVAQLVAAVVADEVALGAQAAEHGAERIAQIVDECVHRNDLDALWHEDPMRLSGGQQQRVAVAAIEACDVDVLVLDEPTALLDAVAAQRFATEVRSLAEGRGVVWITQHADDLALCDRVVVLDAGIVVWSGSVREYVADPKLAATWGLEVPAAARIAHALKARDVWPRSAAIPTRLDELEAVLASHGAMHG